MGALPFFLGMPLYLSQSLSQMFVLVPSLPPPNLKRNSSRESPVDKLSTSWVIDEILCRVYCYLIKPTGLEIRG